MTEDYAKYSEARKESVAAWYRENGERNGLSLSISIQAHTTGCPSIIVAHWLGEEFGWSDELLRIINVIMKYYGYTEIKNKPIGAP